MTKFRPQNQSRRHLATSVLLLTLPLAACAGRGGEEPISTRVELEPPATEAVEDTTRPPEGLPALQVERVAPADGGDRRIEVFAARDEDLRIVLRELAEGLDLDYRIAPEVEGRVSTRLQGVTLEEALRTVVEPHGYFYEIQDGVLFVGPVRLESRIFSLDYVALSRVGQSSTVIQRRLGTGGTGFGGQQPGLGVTGQQPGLGQQAGFGGGIGSDFITSTSVADLWEDIRISLEGLVFDTPEERVAEVDVGVARGVSGTGSRTYSRVGEEGRRLIINPMAGTIHVNAPPRVLSEVETFIRSFEASVQRQVLIEARIVEVTLDREFQFGIDWSIVGRIGNVDLRASSTAGVPNGSQFMLEGGTPEINVVLRSLDEQGDVRVLSSPQVSALNNQRAIFNVTTDEIVFAVSRQPIVGPAGTTVGFSTEIEPRQIAVGIVLDVFPQIGPDNTVSMNIRPAITNVARVETIRTEDGSEARAPVIDRREIDTFARVRPGETVVIGGLMQTRVERRHVGIPVLKDVPVLGYLFGRHTESETRGELVIFLTPTIVAGQLAEGN